MVFSGQHNVLHCPPVANVRIAMYVSSARCLLVFRCGEQHSLPQQWLSAGNRPGELGSPSLAEDPL